MTDRIGDAVLITGASSGIGKATALLLDQAGYKVFAGVRNSQAAERLRSEASDRFLPIQVDITNREHVVRAVEIVENELDPGRGLVALINNAGIGAVSPVEFMPIEVLRRHLEVNLIGHIVVTQKFLSLIRKEKGRIINMGSGSGRFVLPLLGAYCASKFALEALTDAMRRELRPWGIYVSIVEPGTVETPIWEKGLAETDKVLESLPDISNELYSSVFSSARMIMEAGRRRAVTPETVAGVVRKALESKRPKTRYIVGKDARMAVMGSLLPDRLTDWVISKIFSKKLPLKILGW